MIKNNKFKNVYGYIRIGGTIQKCDNFILDIQKSAIDEFCTTHNLGLTNTYVDIGKSGYAENYEDFLKRSELINLLNILNQGDAIIVINTSRLWKDNISKALISKAIKKTNSEIISIERHIILFIKTHKTFFSTL